MKRLLAFLAVVMGGCATMPEGPTPIATSVKTVQADKPVAVACIEAEKVRLRPQPPAVDSAKCTPRQCAAALDMDYRALVDYSEWAEAVIQQCTKGAAP